MLPIKYMRTVSEFRLRFKRVPGEWLRSNSVIFCFKWAHPFKDQEEARASKDHNWDLLILALQWPQAECNWFRELNPSNKCYMPSATNSWTIHGFWPTKYGTTAPNYCNISAKVDLDAIKTIQRELIEKWPYILGSSSYPLWDHEWRKHGTCAAEVLDNFNTELKYFTRGLEFYKTYNISNILRKGNVVPSAEEGYDVMQIFDILRTYLRVNPIVRCKKLNRNSLHEIRICFTKELKLFDCDGMVYDYENSTKIDKVLTNCDQTRPVLYLPYSL